MSATTSVRNCKFVIAEFFITHQEFPDAINFPQNFACRYVNFELPTTIRSKSCAPLDTERSTTRRTFPMRCSVDRQTTKTAHVRTFRAVFLYEPAHEYRNDGCTTRSSASVLVFLMHRCLRITFLVSQTTPCSRSSFKRDRNTQNYVRKNPRGPHRESAQISAILTL